MRASLKFLARLPAAERPVIPPDQGRSAARSPPRGTTPLGEGAVLFQVVAGAAAASVILGQNVPLHQIGDVAQRRVRGAFGDHSPF